jgi:DNA-directed RNA polymerase subunit RPC12/RpoP
MAAYECPACGQNSGISDVFEGDQYECGECGAYLVALTGADGTMRLECEEDVDDALLDDQSPLCDTSVHFREDDGSDVIPW